MLIVGGLLMAILTHALHNFGAGMSSDNGGAFGLSVIGAGVGLGLILITVGLAWQHERNNLHAELATEVGVLLTAEEYEELTGRWRRPINPHAALANGRRQLLVEFANRKHRLRLNGADSEPELEPELAELRKRLSPVGGQAA
jgi:hypothetical protein